MQIVEIYLPLDYYSNLLGVLIDLRVFKDLMSKKLPKLCKHLQEQEFDVDLLLTKWLICLFVNHLPLETELLVWDLFFLKGSQVIFRVALTLFSMMEKEILQAEDMGSIFMIVDRFGYKVDRSLLLKSFVSGITNFDIKGLRSYYRSTIFETLK